MKIVLIGYRGSSESWVSHLPRVASTLGNANRQPQVLEQGLCSPHPIQALVVDQAVRAGHSHATGLPSTTPEKTGVRTPVARSIRSMLLIRLCWQLQDCCWWRPGRRSQSQRLAGCH